MVSLYPKKDNFFLMLHFICTCIKFFTKSIQIIKKKKEKKKKKKTTAYFHNQ